MLEGDDPFLGRVCEEVSSEINQKLVLDTEWYRWDGVYYVDIDRSNLFHYGYFPATIDVAIEHENGKNVEQEMYKMLMLIRCPLKVLIFYDHGAIWLGTKVAELMNMGRKVELEWPEAENTEYLFLVGRRADEGNVPYWRSLVVESGEFRKYCNRETDHLFEPV